MGEPIHYYLSLQSPWSFLGGGRLKDIAERRRVAVIVKPIDITRVFAVSGGLPAAKRPPQRQAYRLVELERWSRFLNTPLKLTPAYFPVDCLPGSRMVLAAPALGADPLALANALGRAVWIQEKNIADPETLVGIAGGLGMDGAALLAAAEKPEYEQRFQALTDEAIEAQVFGVPTYVYRGELFWGQDRLGFLERGLPPA